MPSYKVYLEIFGKKVKCEVLAKNEKEAKEVAKKFVADRVIIIKVKGSDFSFMDLFGMK